MNQFQLFIIPVRFYKQQLKEINYCVVKQFIIFIILQKTHKMDCKMKKPTIFINLFNIFLFSKVFLELSEL